MKYFINCKTLEELKKEYKKLAMFHHPDRQGGDLETMKLINVEYDIMYPKLQNIHNTNTKNVNNQETNTSEQSREIIDTLINMYGILEIEICGTWIYVKSIPQVCNDKLKEIGFTWCGKKFVWALKPIGYIKKSKKVWDMDKIRDSFGSEKIIGNNNFRPCLA
jgi:hypothetical protein